MSWLHRSSEIFKGNIEVLSFEPRESRVFTIEREDGALDTKTDLRLSTQDEWRGWLDQDPSKKESTSSSLINLIIGGQGSKPWGHDPGLVSKMPWSKSTFLRIKTQLSFMPKSSEPSTATPAACSLACGSTGNRGRQPGDL